MSAHGGGSGLRGTAGRWAACLGQRPPPPCAPPASVQQPSDARAPATCPPPAAGPPGHCPAHRRPEFAPHLCPGRWAGRQGQTPGILAGSRVAAVRWPPSGAGRPPLHSARGRQLVTRPPPARPAGSGADTRLAGAPGPRGNGLCALAEPEVLHKYWGRPLQAE